MSSRQEVPPAERDQIALLADGHLTADDPERIETLIARLEALAETCAGIYILGDLFEIWLGVSKAEPAIARVGETLRQIRERGVRTVYLEGNRDFGIGRGVTEGLFDVVERGEMVETFGDVRLHLSHGDSVNSRDHQYRAWRSFSKGILAPIALRALPAETALRVANRLEVRMRSTNRKHKSYFPEELCRRFAEARVAAGADLVVVGHFHHHAVIPIEAGGRHGTFLSLPFWHQEPRPVLVDRAGKFV